MKILLSLSDREYPAKPIKEIREISRALVSDGHGHFAIHHIVRDDVFGHCDYYETPGGGIDQGESPETAVARECQEELGYRVRILAEIGFVDDFYNLIGRENHNHYYLCLREGEPSEKHFVSSGDHLIKETLWLTLEEIVALYEKAPNEGLASLVKARELPFWAEALRESQRALK